MYPRYLHDSLTCPGRIFGESSPVFETAYTLPRSQPHLTCISPLQVFLEPALLTPPPRPPDHDKRTNACWRNGKPHNERATRPPCRQTHQKPTDGDGNERGKHDRCLFEGNVAPWESQVARLHVTMSLKRLYVVYVFFLKFLSTLIHLSWFSMKEILTFM